MLGISGRHLNRRLAGEGASFKRLRDAALCGVAIERLRSDDGLPDIAGDLGFSDESAFAKAFRRWTGPPPHTPARQMPVAEGRRSGTGQRIARRHSRNTRRSDCSGGNSLSGPSG